MNLFAPFTIKNVTFKNRVMFPPLTTGYEERDGSIGDQSFNFYKRLAEGGTGYIVLGDVAPINTVTPTPKLFHDGQIESFRKLADAVHAFGARLGLQLFYPEYDVAALAEMFKKGDMIAARARLHHDMEHYVQEVTEEQIAEILQSFGACARRAAAAGVDVLEIHGDRLVGALCSKTMNQRTDRYGGSFANRTRFALAVVDALKQAAPGLLLEYKLPVISAIPGKTAMRGKAGLESDEAIQLARLLEQAGVDMIHVGQANHTGNAGDIIPPMGTRPYGFFEPYAKLIKENVSVVVSTSGRIVSPEFAQSMLDRGSCDMVGIGRPLVCDPDWVNKASAGKASQIRQCIMCNKGCADAIRNRQFVACVLNAENGHEYQRVIHPATQPKQVVIVGGGPGGLEAARVAAFKGHKVTLFEKTMKLGGQLHIAAVPPRKEEMTRATNFLTDEVARLEVDIRLGHAPEVSEIIALQPDHVIIATGSENRMLPIPGAAGRTVLDAWKVLAGEQTCHGAVAVMGGGLVGAETAELLASRGCAVSIIEMQDTLAAEESSTIRPVLLEELAKNDVKLYLGHTILRITPQAVVCRTKEDLEIEIPCDFAVMALGAGPVPYDAEALTAAGIPCTLIGDCKEKAADIKNAIHAAYAAANAI